MGILIISLIFLSYGIYYSSQPREHHHEPPYITFLPDYSNGTLLVTTAHPSNSYGLGWNYINITLHGPDTIHWEWINLSRSSTPYSGTHAPSEWGEVTIGDVIQIGKYDQNLTVTIRHIPSNYLLFS